MDCHSNPTVSPRSSEDPGHRRWTEQLLHRSFSLSSGTRYDELLSNDREPQAALDAEPQPGDGLLTTSSGSSNNLPRKTPKLEAMEKLETSQTQSTREWVHEISNWSWELLAWLFGTLSILAIVLVLPFFNQKLLSQWKSIISINTTVSVLSQAAVSTLLVSVAACIGQMKWVCYQSERILSDIEAFDLASRGPGGSLRFLCSMRRLP